MEMSRKGELLTAGGEDGNMLSPVGITHFYATARTKFIPAIFLGNFVL